MAIDLDKNYKIIQITKNQSINSNSSYTEVYSSTSNNGRNYLFSIFFNVSSDKLYLRLTMDNQHIIDDLLLDDLTSNSVYRMPKDVSFDFPIVPVSDTSFLIKFPEGIQYNNFSLSFKKESNGSKNFEAGMVTYYDN